MRFMQTVYGLTRNSVKLTDEVHEILVELASKSETFSDVIKRVCEYYKKAHSKK